MAERPFNVREIGNALERVLLDDFGETAAAILRGLIFRSPVGNPDTWKLTSLPAPPGYVGGHFKRNWIVSIGGFKEVELEGIDMTGGPTFATGLAVVEAYTRGKLGVNLVIQNNVPYANRLALGHSRQAKAPWVDEEIDNALTIPGGIKDLP